MRGEVTGGAVMRTRAVAGFGLVCALMACLVGAGAARADSSFSVPSAAISRSLQAVPAQTPLTLPPYSDTTGETVAPFPGAPSYPSIDTYTASQDRGIPLGGIGAGGFEINQAGSFGPWYFGGGQAEWRNLPQAALHVDEQVAGGAQTVRTLAVNGSAPQGNSCLGGLCPPLSDVAWTPGVASAFPTLTSGQATYRALYPFGWISTKPQSQGGPFAASISTRFWSPIVAHDDKRSSMPVAYFDVRVANTTGRRDRVSVMFTFPNAPAHVPNTGSYNWAGGGKTPTGYVGTQLSTRTGLTSAYDYSPQLNAGAVTLGADSPQNTPDEQGQWTIAAAPQPGQQESYVTSWNAGGTGSDIIDSFKAGNGVLPDSSLDSSDSAGAVAVRVDLAPGQSTTIPFVLAWDFPYDVYSANPGKSAGYTVWMRRYTEWFGAKQDAQNNYVPGSYPGNQGWNIAQWALANHNDNLDAVDRWWLPLADNPRVPLPIRTSALNQLYYLIAGGAMWVNGLVSNTATPTAGGRLGTAVPDTHLFGMTKGQDGGDTSSYGGDDVNAELFEAFDRLFPDIERDYLRTITEMVNRGTGPGVGSFGPQTGDPFIQWQPDGSIGHNFQFAYRVLRYYEVTHDTSLFRYAYPAMLALYQRDINTFEVAGSEGALPAGGGRNADGSVPPGIGTTTHDLLQVSGNGIEATDDWMIEVDAMRADTAIAQQLGIPQATPAVYNELTTRFLATKTTLNTALWNAQAKHYNFDTGTGNANSGDYDQGLFAEATYPQDLTQLAGIPSIFDTAKLVQHLQTTWDHDISPFRSDGRVVGAVDLLSANFGVIGDVHPVFLNSDVSAREMWPGQEYPLAAAMIKTGETTGDHQLVSEGTELANSVAWWTWDDPADGYAFQTPDDQGVVFAPPGTTNGNIPVPASETTTEPLDHRNLSYSRALTVWDLYDTLSPPTQRSGWGPFSR
jgi:non-lysosomal glucosylceramidase